MDSICQRSKLGVIESVPVDDPIAVMVSVDEHSVSEDKWYPLPYH